MIKMLLKQDGKPNGPSAIIGKGKLDTGSEGGHTHNTWFWLVTLNLVVTLNLLVTCWSHLT